MSASFRFRLYVAGTAANSVSARANLQALCDKYLSGRHEIEIVDILREPGRALKDNVLLTPMLVKVSPAPVREILGNLSEPEVVLQALGLTPT